MTNKLLSFTYAVSVAFSQALVTFVQIRADQEALAKMTDQQIKQLANGAQTAPIGFKQKMEQ